jgi:hypothetical protein
MLRVLKSQHLKESEVPTDSEETILRAFQALDPTNRGAFRAVRCSFERFRAVRRWF